MSGGEHDFESEAKYIKLWKRAQVKLKSRIANPWQQWGKEVIRVDREIYAIAFTIRIHLLLVSCRGDMTGYVEVWDLTMRRPLRRLAPLAELSEATGELVFSDRSIFALHVSANGKWAGAGAEDGRVLVQEANEFFIFGNEKINFSNTNYFGYVWKWCARFGTTSAANFDMRHHMTLFCIFSEK